MTTAINTVHVPCATCNDCVPAPSLDATGNCTECAAFAALAGRNDTIARDQIANAGAVKSMREDCRDSLDDAARSLTAAMDLCPMGCARRLRTIRAALDAVRAAQDAND